MRWFSLLGLALAVLAATAVAEPKEELLIPPVPACLRPDTTPRCRDGYTLAGNTCYRWVHKGMTWDQAAINCGTDGASLARYDSEHDRSLAHFFIIAANRKLFLGVTRNQKVACEAGKTCKISRGRVAINLHAPKGCEGLVSISECMSSITVEKGCDAKAFFVDTVITKSYIYSGPISAWVGGNTHVVKFGEMKGKAPLQVTPPRLLDPKQYSKPVGCFRATGGDTHLDFTVLNNCNTKHASVCSYELQKNIKPDDYVVVDKKVTFSDAVAECNKLKRPLASLKNSHSNYVAYQLVKKLSTDAWISARRGDDQIYRWADGTSVYYDNFNRDVRVQILKGLAQECGRVHKNNGQWYTYPCTNKLYPICGPKGNLAPYAFSPYFPTNGAKDVDEIRDRLANQGKKDYVCIKPRAVECSAKEAKSTRWVTSNNQKSNTITCTASNISCKSGKELDCKTLKVRFLCPSEQNQCKQIGAKACSGGRQCFPVTNHYVCRCPHGHIWSPMSKKCVKHCGQCSIWGDPHFVSYRGRKFNFMGTCNYKFTGVCNPKQFNNKPYFNVFTANKQCRGHATCLEKTRIEINNIPYTSPAGKKAVGDFVFVFRAYDNKYTLNGETITDGVVENTGYKAIVRKNYFLLEVPALELMIYTSGMTLKVDVPHEFAGKLCGTCGECDSDKFKYRNGTVVDVPVKGAYLDGKTMNDISLSWQEKDDEYAGLKCGIITTKGRCNGTQIKSAQGKSLCGAFLDTKNEFKECFDVTKLNRHAYYSDCTYDICPLEDQKNGICEVVSSFTQLCEARGVTVNWRKADFCPMKCPAGQVFRADASCQRKCGEDDAARANCKEEPKEGCVCADGLFRLGEKCVPQNQCGCRIKNSEGNLIRLLYPGSSMLMPGCEEVATCSLGKGDTPTTSFKDRALPANSVCVDSVPPSTECARGYKSDGKCCKPVKVSCSGKFCNKYTTCVYMPSNRLAHDKAAEACKKEKSSLIVVDTKEKIATVAKLLKEKDWEYCWIAGKVRAYNRGGDITYESLETDDEKSSSYFNQFFADRLSFFYCVDTNSITEKGVDFNVMAKRDGDRVIFKAVKTAYPSNYICEKLA